LSWCGLLAGYVRELRRISLFLESTSHEPYAKRVLPVRQLHTVQFSRFLVGCLGGAGDEESSEKAIQ
jgi:hypothetical protein